MQCPICGFKDFRETPTRFKCNLCGKTIKKHQEPMKKNKPDSYLSDKEKFLKKQEYGG